MERILGKTLHTIREWLTPRRKDPLERFIDGQMSEEEFLRRSGGKDEILDRAKVAYTISASLPPEMGSQERFRIILEGLGRYEKAKHQRSDPKRNSTQNKS